MCIRLITYNERRYFEISNLLSTMCFNNLIPINFFTLNLI